MAGNFLQNVAKNASRAMQFTQENLGNAEKTELDAHLENLITRGEQTREWTQKILDGTEAVLQPNPKVRMEQYVYTQMDKNKRDIVTNEEELGQYMIDAGNQFGPGTAYGNTLIKTGQTMLRIGIAHKQYSNTAQNKFLQPLHNFLNGDVKAVAKEKRELELKRLDLDSAKNKVKKLKSGDKKETDPDVTKAEKELHAAQVEFDRQCEVTKILLEGVASSHAHHMRCMTEYVDSMKEYFDQCQQYTADLQKQLQSS